MPPTLLEGKLFLAYLPHKNGGIPLNALPKDTTSELAGLFFILSLSCTAPSKEVVDTIFHVFWCDSIRKTNPKSTDAPVFGGLSVYDSINLNRITFLQFQHKPVYPPLRLLPTVIVKGYK